MDGLVATGAPAGALAQARRVIHPADQDGRPAVLDLLEMAFQTQVRVAFGEHFGVDAAVRGMAGGAAFAQRLVLKDKWPLLGRMALDAIFLLRKQLGAAAGKGDALVRRMAHDAGHPAFGHGMVVGQIELAAHVQVTLVADVLDRTRRFERKPPAQCLRLRPAGGETVRRLDVAARILMQTAGAVAGFAAGIESVLALAISRAWSAVLKLRQISSWHCSHSAEPIYFAPGTSGSTTAWWLRVLQEMAASSRTTAPAASARLRPRRPAPAGGE